MALSKLGNLFDPMPGSLDHSIYHLQHISFINKIIITLRRTTSLTNVWTSQNLILLYSPPSPIAVLSSSIWNLPLTLKLWPMLNIK